MRSCVQPATVDLAKVHKGRRSDPCPQLKFALQVLRRDTNLQCFKTSEDKSISWFYLLSKKMDRFVLQNNCKVFYRGEDMFEYIAIQESDIQKKNITSNDD